MQNGPDTDPRIFMRTLQLPLGSESRSHSRRDTAERAEILPQVQKPILEQTSPTGARA